MDSPNLSQRLGACCGPMGTQATVSASITAFPLPPNLQLHHQAGGISSQKDPLTVVKAFSDRCGIGECTHWHPCNLHIQPQNGVSV